MSSQLVAQIAFAFMINTPTARYVVIINIIVLERSMTAITAIILAAQIQRVEEGVRAVRYRDSIRSFGPRVLHIFHVWAIRTVCLTYVDRSINAVVFLHFFANNEYLNESVRTFYPDHAPPLCLRSFLGIFFFFFRCVS